MDWKKPETKGDKSVTIPFSWLHLHYYDALSALFRVENALRMFVYVVLKNSRKAGWSDLTLTSDDGGESTIAAVAKRRLTQDERFGYLGYRVGSPLMHLTSGELIRIILSDAYWPMFAEYFPATKEIVRTKLEEIGNIRNALAHFRPIKADDVEVVKQNANQVLSRVEEVLANITLTQQNVPTNTTDPWYVALKSVASPHCSVVFNQSENERWIQLRLIHSTAHIGAPYLTDSYRHWRVLTVIPPNLLRSAPAVLNHVIYASESLPYIRSSDDQVPEFKKYVDMVFSRKTLADSHEEIKADLERAIQLIASEGELIGEDNLARGQVVRATVVMATKRNDAWVADRSRLLTPFREDDPVEYWNRKPSTSSNLVTDTERYPWMPVDISDEDDEVPF